MKAPFYCENCNHELKHPVFRSVGAKDFKKCTKCDMTTMFKIVKDNREDDIYQELQEKEGDK